MCSPPKCPAGPVRASSEHYSIRYLKIRRGLDISDEYTMYSWKHTEVINIIQAGIPDEDIMVLTGHKTKDAFNVYRCDLVIDKKHVTKAG